MKIFQVEYRALVQRGAQKRPVLRPLVVQVPELAQERASCAQRVLVRQAAGLSLAKRLNWARS